ncbi:hypothetical protein L2E82_37977 [Cichorium intybus]|uniref:Uncharacterized protein n=1 Tax=Cichorium intybus TaxID=13427 RepID=A0ACB9AFY8_CICIN|nr:hypothetical protein L2E82_37977 [Cichorium intybus]
MPRSQTSQTLAQSQEHVSPPFQTLTSDRLFLSKIWKSYYLIIQSVKEFLKAFILIARLSSFAQSKPQIILFKVTRHYLLSLQLKLAAGSQR